MCRDLLGESAGPESRSVNVACYGAVMRNGPTSRFSVFHGDPLFAKGAKVRSLSGPEMETSAGGERPTAARFPRHLRYAEVGTGADVECGGMGTEGGTSGGYGDATGSHHHCCESESALCSHEALKPEAFEHTAHST